MKKRSQAETSDVRATDTFSDSAPSHTSRRSHKLKLLVTDDGLDWSHIPDDRKVDVYATLASDEELASTLRLMQDDAKASIFEIGEKHINWFLDAIEALEKFIVPRMVARKSIGGLPAGQFRIDPDIAEAAFKFKNRKELVPCGVEAANKNLPEKIKKLLARVGPGSEFAGRLLKSLSDQQMLCVTLQVQKIQRNHAARGGATASPAASPVPSQKPPNGAPASVAVTAAGAGEGQIA